MLLLKAKLGSLLPGPAKERRTRRTLLECVDPKGLLTPSLLLVEKLHRLLQHLHTDVRTAACSPYLDCFPIKGFEILQQDLLVVLTTRIKKVAGRLLQA